MPRKILLTYIDKTFFFIAASFFFSAHEFFSVRKHFLLQGRNLAARKQKFVTISRKFGRYPQTPNLKSANTAPASIHKRQ